MAMRGQQLVGLGLLQQQLSSSLPRLPGLLDIGLRGSENPFANQMGPLLSVPVISKPGSSAFPWSRIWFYVWRVGAGVAWGVFWWVFNVAVK